MSSYSILYIKEDRKKASQFIRKLKQYAKEYRIENLLLIEVDSIDENPFSIPLESDTFIILCTPGAAKNDRMDECIRTINRDNKKLIPFILHGIPYSESTGEECFCAFFKEDQETEYFAPNVQEAGYHNALIKLISTLEQIPLETILQSRKKWRMRKRIIWTLIISAFLLYVAADEWYITTKKIYYADYTYKNGMPTGIHRIWLPEITRMTKYYVFNYAEDSLVKVERIGEKDPDICQDVFSGIADPFKILVFTDYLNENCIDSLIYVGDDGEIIACANFSAGNTCIDYSKNLDGLEPFYIKLGGEDSQISRCKLTYAEDGTATRVDFYHNSANQPEKDAGGNESWVNRY